MTDFSKRIEDLNKIVHSPESSQKEFELALEEKKRLDASQKKTET